MSDFDATARALRRWTADHDPHVRAAVELLIEHETWIRRGDFQRACIERNAREAWVNWRKAREFAGSGAMASTSEMAVLDLAVALGENRYRFSIMGPANSRMIAEAVACALGEDEAAALGTAAEDARRLDAIRGVLDHFDWEHDDRQLALEAIERIADGAQP
jgi:hypothetical protein